MARKTAKKTRRAASTPSRTTTSRSTSSLNESKDIKEVVIEMISHPAVKYVASGLATAILTRLATSLSEKYPEISNFLKDNLDNFESGIRGFQGNNSELSSRTRN